MVLATHRITLFCSLTIALAFLTIESVSADDAEEQAKQQTERKKSLQVMLGQAKQILVQIGTTKEAVKCELKELPLIHYSDQIRRLPESTLWVWEKKGAPVLFCKIERMTAVNDGATKNWQYCCVPATSEKADVTWGRNFRWRMREPSFHWSPLADAPEPRDQPRARLTQMKAIARQFSGRTEQSPINSQQEMRLLTSPLHQYVSPEQDVIDGAVFGLTSNGTNPDVLLMIEALREAKQESKWRYAVVGMTGDAAEVTHQEKNVWSKPFSDGPGDYRSWMWYLSPP